MKKTAIITAAALVAMTSFATAQQSQTPGASKAGTTQSPDENAKAKGTTGMNSGTSSGSASGNTKGQMNPETTRDQAIKGNAPPKSGN